MIIKFKFIRDEEAEIQYRVQARGGEGKQHLAWNHFALEGVMSLSSCDESCVNASRLSNGTERGMRSDVHVIRKKPEERRTGRHLITG